MSTAHTYPRTRPQTCTHKAFTKLHWLPDLLFKTLPSPEHFEIKAQPRWPAVKFRRLLGLRPEQALRQWKAQAGPAEQGLMGADRSTVVKVINTTEILKQHKPQY